MAQDVCQASEGHWENQAPVAYLEIEEDYNIANVYAADGTLLAQISYRPFDERLKEHHYLFIV